MKKPGFFKILGRKSAKQKLKIGLDVGKTALRALTLIPDKDKPTISSFLYLPIAKTALESIQQAVTSLSLTNYQVNIGLSGSGVIIRYINLPKMTKEEMRGAIQFEAEKHIPFPIRDVCLDAYILDEHLPGGQMLVLLAAAKKELVQQCMQLMRSAGLEIGVIDINILALINAFFHCQKGGYFKQEEPDKSLALLDIGLEFSSLNIIEGNLARLSRNISLGAKSFKSSNKETVLLNLTNEIRRSFDFYESQSERSLEAIFLSGEGAKSEGIDGQSIASNLTLPIKFWDPSQNCNIGPKVDKDLLKSQAHTLAVALGLALR